eukprot:SAG31_NODE_10009_length_1197_cov_0.758652_1_plen_128_part_00
MHALQSQIYDNLLAIHYAAWTLGADTVAVTLPPAGWSGFGTINTIDGATCLSSPDAGASSAEFRAGSAEFPQVAAVRAAVNERLPAMMNESLRTNGQARGTVFDLGSLLSPQNELTRKVGESIMLLS